MNNWIKIGFGFLAGAAAGGCCSYIISKKRYEKELNDLLKTINKKEEETEFLEVESEDDVKVTSSFEKPDLVDYLKMVKEKHYDYTNPASNLEVEVSEDEALPEDVTFISTNEDSELKEPYPIGKEEFGHGFPVAYFTAYGPKEIMDEYGSELNEFEIEDKFGEDYDSYFHDWAVKRKLCIRNEIEGFDYEILYDDKYTPDK